MAQCKHISLTFSPSIGGENYKRPTEAQIREALYTTSPAHKRTKEADKLKGGSNAKSKGTCTSELAPQSHFPAPLALPGDELDLDPEYPAQSVQDWIDEEDRNEVTNEHKTIYIVPPPGISEEVAYVEDWTLPTMPRSKSKSQEEREITPMPSFDDAVKYLQAFYHGLKVEVLATPSLHFVEWESPGKKHKARAPSSTDCRYVGVSIGDEAIRIRCRASVDKLYSKQLNLNDLLEVAIGVLPGDAYAALMLVNHDIYEDDQDDFCCGRAYGGSRVAVVSTARYRPELDQIERREILGHRWHAWPSSHCCSYMDRHFTLKTPIRPPGDGWAKTAVQYHPDSAIASAVGASSVLPLASSPSELSTLWLGRICKTASHEIGHCFGIDHCTYYACIMQATARLNEDFRQPPYLCPIDLSKLLRATRATEEDRYKALLLFCDRWKDDRMFAAYGAWIHSVMDARETKQSLS